MAGTAALDFDMHQSARGSAVGRNRTGLSKPPADVSPRRGVVSIRGPALYYAI
jgi:hypothetical protein